jgi:hypothetical protein
MPDDREEPSGSCICCYRRDPLPELAPVCGPCRNRLAAALWEIRDLHALLPAALNPGQGEKQRVSGSREAPLPLRVGPLDLAGAPTAAAVHDAFGDQEGSLPVAAILDTWARDWQTYLEAGSAEVPLPAAEVPALTSWLSRHLQWAFREHPAIDEFNREVIVLLYTLRSLLNVSRAPVYLHEACPTCGLAALRREAMYQTTSGGSAGGNVVCGECHRVWTFEDFDRLAVVLADETVTPPA